MSYFYDKQLFNILNSGSKDKYLPTLSSTRYRLSGRKEEKRGKYCASAKHVFGPLTSY